MKFRMVWRNVYIPSDLHWVIETEGQKYWPMLVPQYQPDGDDGWYDFDIELVVIDGVEYPVEWVRVSEGYSEMGHDRVAISKLLYVKGIEVFGKNLSIRLDELLKVGVQIYADIK